MITCAVFLLSTLTAFTVFKLKASQVKTSYKIPFYPLPPVLFSLGNLILIIYLTLESWQNTIWGLGISLSGIPIYFLFKKKILKTP
jgi:APA family basic amino acid/polyamine antiporter